MKPTDFESRLSAGLEFEDYVADCYRQKGWEVFHRGRDRPGADLGLDLVAVKNNRYVLVQCKRWATGREIPSEVIQRFGRDCEAYQRRRGHGHPALAFFSPPEFVRVFATTCELAEDAWSAAEAFKIVVRERVQFPVDKLSQVSFATEAPKNGSINYDHATTPVLQPPAFEFDAPEPLLKQITYKLISVVVVFVLVVILLLIGGKR